MELQPITAAQPTSPCCGGWLLPPHAMPKSQSRWVGMMDRLWVQLLQAVSGPVLTWTPTRRASTTPGLSLLLLLLAPSFAPCVSTHRKTSKAFFFLFSFFYLAINFSIGASSRHTPTPPTGARSQFLNRAGPALNSVCATLLLLLGCAVRASCPPDASSVQCLNSIGPENNNSTT